MTSELHRPKLRIRIVFDESMMIGPGKVELLERIGTTGSIAAAGRQMGMSYKRAWMLVEKLNGMFREPLVESMRGGPGGGGASLTAAGQRVIQLYRELQQDAASACAPRLGDLQQMLTDISSRK